MFLNKLVPSPCIRAYWDVSRSTLVHLLALCRADNTVLLVSSSAGGKK